MSVLHLIYDTETKIVGVAPHCLSEAFYEGREKEVFAYKNYPGDEEGIPARHTWDLLTP